MLHRPDQTSRGDPAEEPRVRFSRVEFARLSARFGPFTEFLGAERTLAEPSSGDEGRAPALWAHPSFATVASALRLMAGRISLVQTEAPTGLIVVPWAPEAAWWRLTRHFVCVARFPIGSRHLVSFRSGAWRPVSARRPTAIFAFPRTSGAVAMQLSHLCELGREEVQPSQLDRWARLAAIPVTEEAPLPVGSLLYVPLRVAEPEGYHSDAGCLYRLEEAFDGRDRPRCSWLRRYSRSQRRDAFRFDYEASVATASSGSLAEGRAFFLPDVQSLWLVNHHELAPSGSGRHAPGRVRFDYVRAEEEIARRREQTSEVRIGRLMGDLALTPAGEALRELSAAGAEDTPARTDGDRRRDRFDAFAYERPARRSLASVARGGIPRPVRLPHRRVASGHRVRPTRTAIAVGDRRDPGTFRPRRHALRGVWFGAGRWMDMSRRARHDP